MSMKHLSLVMVILFVQYGYFSLHSCTLSLIYAAAGCYRPLKESMSVTFISKCSGTSKFRSRYFKHPTTLCFF